jgi:hypothetical protein
MNIKDCLEKNDIIGSVKFQMRHPSSEKKVWIIVEGRSDEKIFSRLIDGDNVVFETSHGGVKPLLEAVSELIKETKYVLGIRDADFMHLEKKSALEKNIFITDFHDMEMMLVSSDETYNNIAKEYLPKEQQGMELREKIMISIKFLSGLRWINHCENIELKFKGLSLGNFYNAENFNLNKEKCLSSIFSQSQEKKREPSIEDIDEKIKDISIFSDLLNLCNGHDFNKAFALYVNFISEKSSKVKDKDIEKAFRIAYSNESFKKTSLYKKLKKWSSEEGRYLFKK